MAEAVVAQALLDRRGDVGGEFDDLHHRAGIVENRIIGGLDIDVGAGLGDTTVFGRLEFAARQGRPELGIFRAFHLGGIAEQAVVVAHDLVKTVAQNPQKIGVGGDDLAGHRKLDNGLGAIHRGDLAGIVQRLQLVSRDVGGELDDLDDAPRAVPDRIIGRLQPDGLASAAEALEFARLEPPLGQVGPEAAIGLAVHVLGVAKQAVVPPHYVLETIAHGRQEQAVGGQYLAGRRKLDDGPRGVQSLDDRMVGIEIILQKHASAPNLRRKSPMLPSLKTTLTPIYANRSHLKQSNN